LYLKEVLQQTCLGVCSINYPAYIFWRCAVNGVKCAYAWMLYDKKHDFLLDDFISYVRPRTKHVDPDVIHVRVKILYYLGHKTTINGCADEPNAQRKLKSTE